jgi:cysteine desulfurase
MVERTYLDYCATTPVAPAVLEAMLPCLQDQFGNPSSLHSSGHEADALLARARAQVAQDIGADPEEIVFTSGATEANNLALNGILRRGSPERTHLITSAIEHHAVLHTAEALARRGFELTVLPVDTEGCVRPEDLRAAIRPHTALISIMYVNNELGSLQPIADLAAIAVEQSVPFHCDAVQAIGYYAVDVHALGIDLLSLSAHKIYGPKGVGALFVRKGIELAPQLLGGPQEHNLRAGTQNLPGIIALGAAMQLVSEKRAEEAQRLCSMRQAFIDQLKSTLPGAVVNGDPERTAPHVISVSMPGADGEMMLFRLDQEGFEASMGSACNAEAIEPSHVLLALGLPMDHIQGTLRFSMGYPTRERDLENLIAVLPEVVEQCRVS